MFNRNNRSHLSLGLLFKDTPHLVIDLWRTRSKICYSKNVQKPLKKREILRKTTGANQPPGLSVCTIPAPNGLI